MNCVKSHFIQIRPCAFDLDRFYTSQVHFFEIRSIAFELDLSHLYVELISFKFL